MGYCGENKTWKEGITTSMGRNSYSMPEEIHYTRRIVIRNDYRHTFDYLMRLFERYGNYPAPEIDERKIKRTMRRIVFGNLLIGRTMETADILARMAEAEMRYEAKAKAKAPIKARANQYVEYYRRQEDARIKRLEKEREDER